MIEARKGWAAAGSGGGHNGEIMRSELKDQAGPARGTKDCIGTEVKAIVIQHRKLQGAAPSRILRTFVAGHFLKVINKTAAVRENGRLVHGPPLARESRFAIGALVLNALTVFF